MGHSEVWRDGLRRANEHLLIADSHLAAALRLARDHGSPERGDQIEALFRACVKLEKEIDRDMEEAT